MSAVEEKETGRMEAAIRTITRNYVLGLPGHLAALAAAFVNVYLTVAICMALAIFFMVGRSH